MSNIRISKNPNIRMSKTPFTNTITDEEMKYYAKQERLEKKKKEEEEEDNRRYQEEQNLLIASKNNMIMNQFEANLNSRKEQEKHEQIIANRTKPKTRKEIITERKEIAQLRASKAVPMDQRSKRREQGKGIEDDYIISLREVTK